MESLEQKMKGTEAENSLTKLFVGKTKTYIKCIDVDYSSERVEDFWDIQLNVRGFNNLDESFRDYIAEETMDGENKYYAEGYGLQEAKKGVIFESFPEVLHLHLKRFEYDFNTMQMQKVCSLTNMFAPKCGLVDKYRSMITTNFPKSSMLHPIFQKTLTDQNLTYMFSTGE